MRRKVVVTQRFADEASAAYLESEDGRRRGFGRIGRAAVRRLVAFESHVLVHTPHPDAERARKFGVEYATLPTIFAASDYLTLHAPLTAETIMMMKESAFVINTARVGLVEDRDRELRRRLES
jgi:phosphoglycerate dehydrogenase-like enzyme